MLRARTGADRATGLAVVCGLACGLMAGVAAGQSQQQGAPQGIRVYQPGQRVILPPPGTPPVNAEGGVAPATHLPAIEPHDGAVVQVALLLDTSNSMDGLIEQAKATLWAIVNELSRTRHKGEPPQLQVALYEYGNNWVPAEVGHIRQRAPFTTDLDVLSEQLFGLRTNGGNEYCGEVIGAAMDELIWWMDGEPPAGWQPAPRDDRADSDGDLKEAASDAVVRAIEGASRPAPRVYVDGPVVKIVVIAGNEPFTQGTTAYQETIAAATAAGVVVNTIHCGDRATGASTGWEDGARLGGGMYASIDQDKSVVEPPTPYDERLGQLNDELNATYLAYGAPAAREAARTRQAGADVLNAEAGQAPARYAAKASVLYINTSWDLVDAVQNGEVDLASISPEKLPDELRGKSVEEMRAAVDRYFAHRQAVQGEMRSVSAERAAWLAEHAGAAGGGVLAEAVLTAIREQVEAHGLAFAAPATEEAPEEAEADE